MKQRKVPLRKCTGCSGNEGQTGIDPHRAQRCRRIFSGLVQARNRDGAQIFAPIRNVWQRRRSPKVWNAPSKHLCPRMYMKPCWHSWKEKKIMRKFYSLLGLCKRANKVAGGEVAAEEAIRGKKACLVIVAGDARRQIQRKNFITLHRFMKFRFWNWEQRQI